MQLFWVLTGSMVADVSALQASKHKRAAWSLCGWGRYANTAPLYGGGATAEAKEGKEDGAGPSSAAVGPTAITTAS